MFETLLTQYFLHPRIVHQLPGRLRVHIPALLHISSFQKEFEELLTRLLLLPKGIKKAKVQCLTGNVLIEYEDQVLSEKEILRWIRQIGNVLIKEQNNFLNTSAEKMPVVIDRIIEIIQKSIRYRLDLLKEIVIPNDVWR